MSAIFVGVDVLLTVYIFFYFLPLQFYHARINQAANGVSTSYDALLDLFECVANFLKRLQAYTEITLNPTMTDIIVKIMVQVLSVLALATKQIKQGRFSERILIYPFPIADYFCREVCKETVGRERDRGCATEVGPPHPRGSSHDRSSHSRSRPPSTEQYEACHGRYAIPAWLLALTCAEASLGQMAKHQQMRCDRLWVCLSCIRSFALLKLATC